MEKFMSPMDVHVDIGTSRLRSFADEPPNRPSKHQDTHCEPRSSYKSRMRRRQNSQLVSVSVRLLVKCTKSALFEYVVRNHCVAVLYIRADPAMSGFFAK